MRVMCKEDDAVEPEIIKISHLSKSFGDVKAVNGLALILCLCCMYKMGWYMSAADVLWIMGDEILIVLLAAHFPALSAFR